VEFCVEWAQPRAWQKILPQGASVYNYGVQFSSALYASEYVNGFIYVVPFTELTSPNGSPISVNVFVRSSDMLFQQPTEDNMPTNRRVVAESADFHESKYSGNVSCVRLNKMNLSLRGMSDLHFGEQILSFRSLLHRYVTTSTSTIASGNNGNFRLHYADDIIIRPFPTYGNVITNVAPTLVQYLPYAFLGSRGGVRKRFHLTQSSSSSKQASQSFGLLNRVCVHLSPVAAPTGSSITWLSTPAPSLMRGTVMFVPATNGGVEFELPYYSPNLFNFAFNSNYIGTNADNDMVGSWSTQFFVDVEVADCSQDTNTVMVESSIGDDFSFLRYTGAPFYKVASLP